ncbi:Flp pilus assembly protein CpaB [Oryzibacter oryziterrae]|uniref:Flp pilus assembly protein CpaB n=1 Tax=Oryzibacter oryziterrae TaxID=2766474 RepID=UPI002106C224|nr:Flp pilus assembly protein CpaB [Oryzibacter oryziterrae]
MRPIQLVILLVALGAAGGAGLLAMKISDRPPVEQPVAGQPVVPNIETEEVLVASQNVSIGGGLSDLNVKWAEWPKSGVAEGYVVRSQRPDAVSEMKGMLARAPILAGEPIREARLVRSDRGFLSAILPSGMRAVAVPVNVASTAGGFVLPEDRVDIMLVSNDGKSGPNVKVLLSNIRVLAIDQKVEQTGEDKNATIVAQNTATLELTPDQTQLVLQAQQMGNLSLVLRSIADANAPAAEASEERKARGVSMVKFGVVSRVSGQQ